MKASNTKYFAQIDGLRFISVMLLLFLHFGAHAANHFNILGNYFIDIFFVISGFLITTILLKPNDKGLGANYKNFMGRRILRIFPVYYLTIFVLWLLHMDVVREHLALFLTYTFNYGMVNYHLPFTYAIHFWSLCVEEQFYLLWPIIVLSLKKDLRLLTIITVCIIITGYAQNMFNIIPALTPYNDYGLLTRMASLGMGALSALLVARGMLPSEKIMNNYAIEILSFVVLTTACIITFPGREIVFSICATYFVLKAALYGFRLRPVNTLLSNRHIIALGTLAYGIYVFHLPIAYYFGKCWFDGIWEKIDFSPLGRFKSIKAYSWIVKFPLQTALSIGLAWLSFRYIETPILKLKDRYFKY